MGFLLPKGLGRKWKRISESDDGSHKEGVCLGIGKRHRHCDIKLDSVRIERDCRRGIKDCRPWKLECGRQGVQIGRGKVGTSHSRQNGHRGKCEMQALQFVKAMPKGRNHGLSYTGVGKREQLDSTAIGNDFYGF